MFGYIMSGIIGAGFGAVIGFVLCSIFAVGDDERSRQ